MVDGMKLYEDLLDETGVRRLVSLITDLRAAGKGRQFQGKSTSDFASVSYLFFLS